MRLRWRYSRPSSAPTGPLNFAVLAAAYGHLGEIPAAREAIDRHRALTPIDLGDWAQTWVRNETLHALILKGFALAGESAAPGAASAQ
jgi:hypothetical protein